MRRCPECRRDYHHDETLLYCLDDGSRLVEGPGAEDDATVILPAESSYPRTASEKKTKLHDSGDFISEELRRHKLRSLLIVAVSVVLLGGFGYGVYRFFDRAPGNDRPTATNIQTRRLTGDGRTWEAAISPDGKFLVFARLDRDRQSLWIKQILTDSNVPVQTSTDLTNFSDLTFSPDGNFVYFNGRVGQENSRTLYKVPTLGGPATKVLTSASQLEFSPDGRQLAFARGDQASAESAVFIANPDGSNERKLASRTGRQFFNAGPTWSPDGKFVAISSGDDDLVPKPDEGVVLISVEDGREVDLGTTKWAALTALKWHPNGDSLLVVASDYDVLPGQLWEIAYPSGEVRRLTNNLNGYDGVSMTADGSSIVTMERYSRSSIWVSPNLNATEAKPIMPLSGDTWGFSWTPDNRIVYVSDQSGDAEVWIMNADGSDQKQLTRDRVFKGFPDVSTDGRFIVYASGAGGLTRIDINGANPSPLTPTGFGQDNPDISPDGQWVLYSAWVDGKQRILRVPLTGGEATVLTDIESTEPRYSPDGAYFACFVLDEKTQDWGRLAVYPATGGKLVKSFEVPAGTSSHRGPLWTPDGKAITVLVSRGERVNLWKISFEDGKQEQLTDLDIPFVARRDYSRDGKRIAVVRAEGIRNAVMITGFR